MCVVTKLRTSFHRLVSYFSYDGEVSGGVDEWSVRWPLTCDDVSLKYKGTVTTTVFVGLFQTLLSKTE